MRTLMISCLLATYFFAACSTNTPDTSDQPKATQPANWAETTTTNSPTARHEAAFVAVGKKAYLLGGRGIKPVDIYDPVTKTWSVGDTSPVEIHHFQPVVYNEEIYLMGAMTGGYPGETPLPDIHIYSPAKNEWRTGASIPEGRRRGGAGAVLHNGLIYMICGIQDGHRGGHVPWLDAYNPETDEWAQLPDAPRSRDHFQAVAHGSKLYAPAGRTTVAATNPFANTIGEVDVYDLTTQQWATLPDTLPTHRAGNAAFCLDDELLVVGGESTAHEVAHNEVEAMDLKSGTWSSLAPLSRGRHGTGVVQLNGQLIMASGCGNRGGQPELADVISMFVNR